MNYKHLELAPAASDKEPKYRAPALEKGLDILELLASEDQPMSTSQMAVRLERSVSELFRMVLALEQRGYIQPHGDGRYSLTNRLFALGLSQGLARSLLDAALPVMSELAGTLGQSCHLAIASGEQLVVIARVESPKDLGFSVRVGYRRRLVDTHSGQILYGLAPTTVRKRWQQLIAPNLAAGELEDFEAKARDAAARGHVHSPSEFVDGVTDLCVPVLGAQGAIATLNVPFIAIRDQQLDHRAIIDQLILAAHRIATSLSAEA